MITTAPNPAAASSSPAPGDSKAALRRYSRDVGGHTLYLLIGFPIAIVAFVLVITLVAVGVSTLIIWVGLPILVGGVMTARGFAHVERGLQRSLLHTDAPTPAYVTGQGSPVRRMLAPLRDPQSWLDVLWTTVHFIVSTVTFSIAITWWVGAIATVLGPLSVFVLDVVLPADNRNLADILGLSIWVEAAAYAVLGLAFAATLPAVLRGLALAQSMIAHTMLSLRADSAQQIGQLRDSRNAVRVAETEQLRRLERDIHDGPQQRLVRLNMDLARARRMASTDPERAQMVLADAMDQTQDTLAELRQLSRGIAPPILVDRGLTAAVTEAAARSTVPAGVRLEIPRLPDHVEAAAYFVISEALANINKHSGATEATILGGVEKDWLFLAIFDNGQGGADPAKGHGLAGLAERLKGVDGTLSIDSPVGGPTTLEAAIPCGS